MLKVTSSVPAPVFEEEQDNGDTWRAVITIERDRFIVDLSDNPPTSSGPYNTSRDGAVIAAQMIFKALCDPDRFANAGSFAPLQVITRDDTIFQASASAPQGYYFETRIRLFDLLWQCVARAMPGKLPVGHFASICGTVIAGLHPDTGRRYTMVEPQMGGWGATDARYGMDAMYSCSHGDTFNCPVEICEARYGLEVVYKRLGERSEVRNGFAGGRGVSLAYRLRANAVLSVGFTRNRVPVWSTDAGSPGGRNAVSVRRQNDKIEQLSFASGVEVVAGDEVVIETAFGGGLQAASVSHC